MGTLELSLCRSLGSASTSKSIMGSHGTKQVNLWCGRSSVMRSRGRQFIELAPSHGKPTTSNFSKLFFSFWHGARFVFQTEVLIATTILF
jgi:hypothetical protein